MSSLVENNLNFSDLRSRLAMLLLAVLILGMLVPGCQIQFADAQIGQTLSLNPDHGYPGTVVNVTGIGYNSFVVEIGL